MTGVDDLLERAAALLEEVAGASVADLTDGSLVAAVQRVEAVGRWVDAARCVVAAEVDERSAWGSETKRSPIGTAAARVCSSSRD